MALYQLDAGKINGVDYRGNNPILTVEGNKITIRLSGDAFPFIQADLSEFINSAGAAFATIELFKTYWNSVISSPISITPAQAVETPSMAVYAASAAAIVTGSRSVTIITSTDFVGTILGVAAEADMVYTWTAQVGNTLGAFATTCSAGSHTILRTV